MAATHPRVLIANINRGQISTQTAAGFIDALHTGAAMTVLMAESGPYLDDGRNRAVANALEVDGWDWLLFVDSDIEFVGQDVVDLFAPVAPNQMASPPHPIMCGVYYSAYDDGGVPGEEEEMGGHIGPVVYEWIEREDLNGERRGIPTETYRRLSRKSFNAIPPIPGYLERGFDVVVAACVGTGFMGIHRSLLTRLESIHGQPTPWFNEPIINGVHMGEDMGFCHRVVSLGYPVLVNRACNVTHLKTIKLA